MQMRSFLLTAGLSAVAGAAAILMLPANSRVRQCADRMVDRAEDAMVKTAESMMMH